MVLYTIISIALLILMNLSRFFMTDGWNRFLLSVGGPVIVYGLFFVDYSSPSFEAYASIVPFLPLLLFVPVWIGGICYQAAGGLSASVVNMILLNWFVGETQVDQVFLGLLYLLVGVTWGQYIHSRDATKLQAMHLMTQLRRQSKELNIVREISTALQTTQDRDKLLHIVMTAITSGYGHGINRAMMFLVDEEGSELKGALGIGSISREEGLSKWMAISMGNMTLTDYITNDGEVQTHDVDLNSVVRNLSFPLNPPNILSIPLNEHRPLYVTRLNMNDPIERKLNETVQIGEFAVVPLVIQGSRLGILILDNNIKQIPISREQLDSIIPLANQATIAIHNSSMYNRAQEMAITDGLTGLYNQRFFDQMLNSYFNTTRRNKIPLALIVIDVDFFKVYNDTNGHVAGNEVLIGVANILKESIRKDDLSFRFGGEEFVILLSSTTKQDALLVAEKIRTNIQEFVFENEEKQPGGDLTVSLGVASFPEDQESPQALLHSADLALYQAKKGGRNRVVGYEEGME